MKKLLILAFLSALMAVGCEDINLTEKDSEPLIDYSPVQVLIYATNVEGHDIISAEMPGMSLTYKGITYEVTAWNHYFTKALYASEVIQGLCCQTPEDYLPKGSIGHNRLIFGDIPGDFEVDEDFVLSWPDGTKNVIHYYCKKYPDEQSESKVNFDRCWTLDGQHNEGSVFIFEK